MLAKRKLDEKEVSLEIDLKKLFGTNVTDPSLRRSIAESLIETINKRTEKGDGVDGNGSIVKLQSPYSKAYSESLEFKAFGKKKNKVNMTLTGSMLSSIDLIDDTRSSIIIGINNEEAPKAYNHMTGDTVPKRPFLGLTSKDLDKVREEFSDAVDVVEPITAEDIFGGRNIARLVNIITGRGIKSGG